MAVTAASLKANRPEFALAADAVITSFIAKAENVTDEDVYGDSYDDAVELTACDMLARSPYARELRLVADDLTTVYGGELDQMRRQYGGAHRMYP